ncbi:MAG: glycosyltransferase 87 family protein [Candidatus Dormibacteraeota bacterium]|nr:glycosyltransferase 87 family protein [Candidatus Dormibacteraeota bacterium]
MAGAPSPAGGLRASVTRAAARLTTPIGYLGVLGGLQVALLWVLRERYGIWLALAATAVLVALLLLLRATPQHWGAKLRGISLLALLTAVGPTLIGIVQRPRIGLTMEHDGMLQLESAIERVLKAQPIYGVDWSNTPMAAFGWDLTPGPNPALHHLAYYPLTVLSGVPFRLLTDALGVPFDYRIVLIAFALLGLAAIIALPISHERRFLLVTAVYASPLVTLFLWSGRTDIEFLAVVLLTLTLLSRGHATLAAAALGIAIALKPFAWVALPFFLLVLAVRWRAGHRRGEVIACLAALALTPVATVLPYFLANPGAFWTDIVLYTSGGVADAYPIAGYGLGDWLYTLHVITRRTDRFPFVIFQLAAVLPVLWLTARAFLRRPTMARWMGGYACLLFAFTFFARFFNDNYAAVVITLLLCVLPLGNLILAPTPAGTAERLAA